MSGKIQEIIDFGTLTQNIESLRKFFHLDDTKVARKNLHMHVEAKRTKCVPGSLVLEKLIESNESNEAIQVFYCKSEEGFNPLCFNDKVSSSSFKSYHLMAYVSINTTTNLTEHYVRFDKNNLKFQRKDCISPYTTPPHAPSQESMGYVWMYIADSCNDRIKLSSLKNSVTYITNGFVSILKRFPVPVDSPFTTANLVTVVIDDGGIVVKDPTPESLVANTSDSDPPEIFVEIVNRRGKARTYDYKEFIHPNYFLMAILQQDTKKSRCKGSSNIEKIWFRYKKEDLGFINIPPMNEEAFQWGTVSKSIQREGVVFVYRKDETW